jgi:hypothetical protein
VNATNLPRWRDLFLAVCTVALLHQREAAAYLDPGTGSLVLQMVAGALLGAAMTARLWWQRAKDIFASVVGAGPLTSKHKDTE